MLGRWIAGAAMGLALFAMPETSNAALITIDFESGPLGAQPNGFSATGVPGVTFTDTIGSDLEVGNYGNQCNGGSGQTCLLVRDDYDSSGLLIDFATPTDFLSFVFGNDQPFGTNNAVDIALTLFLGAVQVGQVIAIPNMNDIGDQTIAFSGALFDRATVFYRGAGGTPATLIEMVDDVTFNDMVAVPEPSTLALFAAGLAGLGWMSRRRRGA